MYISLPPVQGQPLAYDEARHLPNSHGHGGDLCIRVPQGGSLPIGIERIRIQEDGEWAIDFSELRNTIPDLDLDCWYRGIVHPIHASMEGGMLKLEFKVGHGLGTSELAKAIHVIETNSDVVEELTQGTIFFVAPDIGITCAHCAGRRLEVRQSQSPYRDYAAATLKKDTVLDLAVVEAKGLGLPRTLMVDPAQLSNGTQVFAYGFPNYQDGDSVQRCPLTITGTRSFHGVRLYLVTGGILAGMSGCPVVNSQGRVVGMAVRGGESADDSLRNAFQAILPVTAFLSFISDFLVPDGSRDAVTGVSPSAQNQQLGRLEPEPGHQAPEPHQILAPPSVTVVAGTRVPLNVRVLDEGSNPIEAVTVIGSVEGIEGNLTGTVFTAGPFVGTGEIIWRAGMASASTAINTVAADLARIAVNVHKTRLAIGEAVQFTAQGFDLSGNAVPVTPIWYAASGVIDRSGYYVGLSAGLVTVFASSGSVTSGIDIIVDPHNAPPSKQRMDLPEWTETWRYLVTRYPRNRELLLQGHRWLHGREDRPEWPYVFALLLEQFPGDYGLLELGRNWLTMQRNHEGWPTVWQSLVRSFPDDSVLLQMGRHWIRE